MGIVQGNCQDDEEDDEQDDDEDDEADDHDGDDDDDDDDDDEGDDGLQPKVCSFCKLAYGFVAGRTEWSRTSIAAWQACGGGRGRQITGRNGCRVG